MTAALARTLTRPGPAFGIFISLLFFGALFWAPGRDPFERVWFRVKPGGAAPAECVAVLPKTASKPLPVVIFLHGSGGSVLASGNDLRQMAEMGLATVGMDYCQSNYTIFEAQFAALLGHLARQRWADTNRIAWLGYSLGAQRLLSYTFRHPDCRPDLLVRLGGGVVPEMDAGANEQPIGDVGHRTSAVESPANTAPSKPPLSKPWFSLPNLRVLLVHGELEEVFPVADMRRAADALKSSGAEVTVDLLPGMGHSLRENRALIFRRLGEKCLAALKGETALREYHSILERQGAAKPLWLYWVPAGLWACICCGRVLLPRAPFPGRLGETTLPELGRVLSPKAPSGQTTPGRVLSPKAPPDQARSTVIPSPGRVLYVGSWCVAGVLVLAVVAQTSMRLILPGLSANDDTVAAARRLLVQERERQDFDYLAANTAWQGRKLGPLIEHAHLANYNRQLVNWELTDPVFRDYVLNPQIHPASDGGMDWRRTLWESFYPRIRKEMSSEAAAQIVATHLRERVTIAEGAGWPSLIRDAWEKQITNEAGFHALYVAALRSCGIPARLSSKGQAEFWTGAAWALAPRPLVGGWAG